MLIFENFRPSICCNFFAKCPFSLVLGLFWSLYIISGFFYFENIRPIVYNNPPFIINPPLLMFRSEILRFDPANIFTWISDFPSEIIIFDCKIANKWCTNAKKLACGAKKYLKKTPICMLRSRMLNESRNPIILTSCYAEHKLEYVRP